MHEVGMLNEMAKTISKIATEKQVEHVKFIAVDIGELSGVLPQAFEEFFPLIKEQYDVLSGSELKIRMIPGEALCNNCNALYNVMKNEGQCPKCQSRYKKILGGQEIMLQQIGF